MANYANLLATIAANIYTNGNQEVTAAMVKFAVDAMVGSLGYGYQFRGAAAPSDNPGTPDQRVYYLAKNSGTYPNFGGLAVSEDEVAILKWDSAWSKEVLTINAISTIAPRLAQQDAEIALFEQTIRELVENYPNVTIYGNVTNNPDNEDINTNENAQLQFANRSTLYGMGYKILRRDKTFAEQVTDIDTIYEIRYDFTLTGNFTMPDNCELRFNGGSIDGAFTITGQNTKIGANLVRIFGDNISLGGTWDIKNARPEWFGGSVGKCLIYFKTATLSGYYAIPEEIVLDDENSNYSIVFGPNSCIFPADNFVGDYLFVGKPYKYTPYNPATDVKFITFTGCHNVHIDCKGKCAIVYTENYTGNLYYRARPVKFENVVANNCSNDAQVNAIACVNTFGIENEISNCEFRTDRQTPANDFGYMIACWKTDNIITNNIIITSKIGIHAADSSIIDNNHIWGGANVCVEVAGVCVISNLYGDYAKVGVYYNGAANGRILLKNYYLVASTDPNSDYYYGKVAVLKTNQLSLTGVVFYISASGAPIPIINTSNQEIFLPRLRVENAADLEFSKTKYAFTPYYVTKGGDNNNVWFKFAKLNKETIPSLKFSYSDAWGQRYNIDLIGNTMVYAAVIGGGQTSGLKFRSKDLGSNIIELYCCLTTLYAKLVFSADSLSPDAFFQFTYYGQQVDATEVSTLSDIPIVFSVQSARPASTPYTGFSYYDTTLKKPIFWDGTNWKDAAGNNV